MPASPDGYYYLTSGDDNFVIFSGVLSGLPLGLVALEGNDTVQGSFQADTINGNQGNDSISGGGGDDFVLGGKGGDRLLGGIGNDLINGNIGQDYVAGGSGNDTVRGGQDADILLGEDGNDVLIGDFGTDILIGGVGNDSFIMRIDTVLDDPNNADFILDFTAGDRIGVSGGQTGTNYLLRQKDVPISSALSTPLLGSLPNITPELIRNSFLSLTGVDIDPNGDGIMTGTSIELNDGTSLGFVVNSLPNSLNGIISPVTNV